MIELSPKGSAGTWQPGQSLGRYALLTRWSVGGMAEIWLGKQLGAKGFERLVVIKRISEAYANDADFVAMFLDEANIASQLSHPNIVQIYDLGEHTDGLYMAMEYLPGESISAVLAEGLLRGKPISYVLAARLVADAAAALGYAHAKKGLDGRPLNIVHRDVTPQNLLVTYDGILKLVDFGIARAANRSSQTSGRRLKGKLGYVSPEQVRGEPIDARSDIFSLGVVLFEALTRTRLFQFDDEFQAIATIGGDEPIPLARERNSLVPVELEAIAARALARDQSERFQSALQLQHALEDWLRQQGYQPGSAEVAGYLESLFAERIRTRQKLIDDALAGRLLANAPLALNRREPDSLQRELELQPTILGLSTGPSSAAAATLETSEALSPSEPIEARQFHIGEPQDGIEAVDTSERPMLFGPEVPTRAIPIEVAPLPEAPSPAPWTQARRPIPRWVAGLGVLGLCAGAWVFTEGWPRVAASASAPAPWPNVSAQTREPAAEPAVGRRGTFAPAPAEISPEARPAPTPGVDPWKESHEVEAPIAPPAPRRAEPSAWRVRPETEAAAHALRLGQDVHDRSPAPPQARRERVEVSAEPAEGAIEVSRGTGTLQLETTPSVEVRWRGEKLGTTPLKSVALPAGRQVLSLSNEAEEVQTSIEIEIRPGATTSKRLRLKF